MPADQAAIQLWPSYLDHVRGWFAHAAATQAEDRSSWLHAGIRAVSTALTQSSARTNMQLTKLGYR